MQTPHHAAPPIMQTPLTHSSQKTPAGKASWAKCIKMEAQKGQKLPDELEPVNEIMKLGHILSEDYALIHENRNIPNELLEALYNLVPQYQDQEFGDELAQRLIAAIPV